MRKGRQGEMKLPKKNRDEGRGTKKRHEDQGRGRQGEIILPQKIGTSDGGRGTKKRHGD